MSPAREERRTAGDGATAARGRSATRRTLLAFGGGFLALFIAVAVTEGIGNPSVSSGDVVIVEDAPAGLGTISEDQLEHAIEISAVQGQIKPVPKPGSEKYEGLRKAALGELLDAVWIQGQAEEMGFSATPKEVEEELKKIKSQNFPTEKQFEEFLKESNYTAEDVNKRVKVQILSTKIQEQLKEEALPSSGEIEEYYEATKSSQYTMPEIRDARIIVNRDKGEVEEAKAALEEDNSVHSWKKVAKEYSNDSASKSNGGLVVGFPQYGSGRPPERRDFCRPDGTDRGARECPQRGYVIFEVVKVTREKVSSSEEVEPQISKVLSEQSEQENFPDSFATTKTPGHPAPSVPGTS